MGSRRGSDGHIGGLPGGGVRALDLAPSIALTCRAAGMEDFGRVSPFTQDRLRA